MHHLPWDYKPNMAKQRPIHCKLYIIMIHFYIGGISDVVSMVPWPCLWQHLKHGRIRSCDRFSGTFFLVVPGVPFTRHFFAIPSPLWLSLLLSVIPFPPLLMLGQLNDSIHLKAKACRNICRLNCHIKHTPRSTLWLLLFWPVFYVFFSFFRGFFHCRKRKYKKTKQNKITSLKIKSNNKYSIFPILRICRSERNKILFEYKNIRSIYI